MFTICVDRDNALIEATMSGMWSREEVAAYVTELRRLFLLNKLRHYSMVIDVTTCPIQPQEVINAMRDHMATMPKATALAIVTGSSLARMQVRRLFTQPYARITETVEEGRAWVRSGATRHDIPAVGVLAG